MEDEVTIRAAGMEIHGRSAAGKESFYRLPSFRSALEMGRCPEALVSLPNVFVTHSHLDHAAGIATYASQRTLHGLEAGHVFLPAETLKDHEEILERERRLEGVTGPYRARLHGVEPGEIIEIRQDLQVRVEPSCHRVPSVGYTFLEVKRKLQPQFQRLSAGEVAALRQRGVEVAGPVKEAILSYPGDCSAEIFEVAPQIFRSRVLLLECTFLRPGEEEKARLYGHLHLSDIVNHAAQFENRAIVLTHFSAKYSKDEIRFLLTEGLPAGLQGKVIPFL